MNLSIKSTFSMKNIVGVMMTYNVFRFPTPLPTVYLNKTNKNCFSVQNYHFSNPDNLYRNVTFPNMLYRILNILLRTKMFKCPQRHTIIQSCTD